MFVIHDGEEFIDREHLGQRLGVEQFLGSLQGDGVGQSPMRIAGDCQVVNVLHCLLISRIHLLPAKVSATTTSRQEKKLRLYIEIQKPAARPMFCVATCAGNHFGGLSFFLQDLLCIC